MDIKVKLILLVIVAIFVAYSLSLNFTQDDAFISYRYVKNFLNGHGLVFNPGERVSESSIPGIFCPLIPILFFFPLSVNPALRQKESFS